MKMDTTLIVRSGIIWLLLILSNQQLVLSAGHAAAANTAEHKQFPYPFITVDAEKAAAETYDYIRVGGGAAGCPLAATLSQRFLVLIVERGGSPYGMPIIEDESALVVASIENDHSQTFVSEDGVAGARGRILGGSTAINGGFYSRASLKYIQDMGWDEKLLFWKSVCFLTTDIRWITASTFDQKGKRHTEADLLKYTNSAKIVVLLNATASRVIFHAPGFLKENVRSEVIVSAGALGSPQFLLLSGIGPSHHLKSLKIPIILDLPGVGRGMADNPASGATILSSLPLENLRMSVVGIPYDSRFFLQASSTVKVDTQAEEEGVRLIAKIFESNTLMQFGFRNKSTVIPKLLFLGLPPPASENNDATMSQFCRNTLLTYFHNHGGCNIGSVINERYQLIGINGLRVVDASSTYKDNPGTNPQAITMMLGSYKGVRILQERVQ
eukprot:Gb_00922 [translate_table: standard]